MKQEDIRQIIPTRIMGAAKPGKKLAGIIVWEKTEDGAERATTIELNEQTAMELIIQILGLMAASGNPAPAKRGAVSTGPVAAYSRLDMGVSAGGDVLMALWFGDQHLRILLEPSRLAAISAEMKELADLATTAKAEKPTRLH